MKLAIALALAAALGAAAHTPGTAHLRRHHDLAQRAAAPDPDPEPVPALNTTELAKRSFSGRASWYDVGLGACGITNVPSDHIVALNSAQYGGGYPGPQCFKRIAITYQGKTVTAEITDECPGCPYGGLDMSKGLFTEFTGLGTGIFYMTWNFVGANDNPPPAPKPKPKPSPTHSTPPPPPPSSTHHSSSTHSSVTPHSTSSHSHSSASHASSTHTSASASSSSTPAPTPTGNLATLEQAVFNLAVLLNDAVEQAQGGSS